VTSFGIEIIEINGYFIIVQSLHTQQIKMKLLPSLLKTCLKKHTYYIYTQKLLARLYIGMIDIG
jgi:hypothetical protein